MKYSLIHKLKSYIKLCISTLPLFFTPTVFSAEAEPTIIALFGDSITVGYNLSYSQVNEANGTTTHGAPTVELTELLNESPQKRTSIVSNWGHGGSNTTQGLNRITSNLNTLTTTHTGTDRFVLIMYGTNDQAYGISTATTKSNTSTMIDRARSAGYEPIIGTLTPVSNRSVTGYNSKIVEAANSKGAFVVDLYSRFTSHPGGWTSLIELDGGIRLHPNNTGYAVIAEHWYSERLVDVISPDPSSILTGAFLLLLLD